MEQRSESGKNGEQSGNLGLGKKALDLGRVRLLCMSRLETSMFVDMKHTIPDGKGRNEGRQGNEK